MNNIATYLSTLNLNMDSQEAFIKNLSEYLKNSGDVTLFFLSDTPEHFADFIKDDDIKKEINKSNLQSRLKKSSVWYAPATDRSFCESFISTVSNRYACAKQLLFERYPEATILRVSDDQMYINIICEQDGKQRSVDISNTELYERFFKPKEEQRERAL